MASASHQCRDVSLEWASLWAAALPSTSCFQLTKPVSGASSLSSSMLRVSQMYRDEWIARRSPSRHLYVCMHLVAEHLVPSKTPTDIIKTMWSFSVAPVRSHHSCDTARDGSFLIEPLPFFYSKHVSLAHAIVSVNKKKTQCRTIMLVSYATQLQALNELGIEVDTNHYNQSQKKKLVTLLIIIAISLQMTFVIYPILT